MRNDEILQGLIKQYQCPVWRTSDGQYEPVKLMSLDRIYQLKRFLARLREEAAEQYDQINSYDRAAQKAAWALTWIKNLDAEIKRRLEVAREKTN